MMSETSKRELLAALRPRYRKAGRAEKKQILDELTASTGYHRKYAIQLPKVRPWAGSDIYGIQRMDKLAVGAATTVANQVDL